ncbi:hypothetical protein D3C75_1199620 [compost metagenome]
MHIEVIQPCTFPRLNDNYRFFSTVTRKICIKDLGVHIGPRIRDTPIKILLPALDIDRHTFNLTLGFLYRI